MKPLYFHNPSPATAWARELAIVRGIPVTDDPQQAGAVILPIPTPGEAEIPPVACPVFGGNRKGITDLLQDELYLWENARITAHCALALAMQHAAFILPQGNILLLGWGRISQCLAQLLKNLGCKLTVAARKEKDRAAATALGHRAIPIEQARKEKYSIVFNTVPAPVLEVSGDTLAIDLASQPGLLGETVLWARGLPGKMAPKSSGELILDTVLRIMKEEKA